MNPKLIVEQKITPFANKYSVYAAEAGGTKGQLVALAQQKRLAFKEKVTFYAGGDKSQTVFSFRAEKAMDIHGRYFVEDPGGKVIGVFKKDFTKSLVNSTWNILGEDGQSKITISENNQTLAIARRFGGLVPILGGLVEIITAFLRYHFVFRTSGSDQILGTYQKTSLLRDHYLLSMNDEIYNQEDWRVLAAVAVALDALQSR